VKRRLSPGALYGAVAGGLLVYALVGWFLLVGPKRAEAGKLKEEVAAAEQTLSAARLAAVAKPDVQPIAVADIFRLATAMPSSPDMPGILLELSRIAEETGIRFKSISPQSAVPVGAYQSVPIDVTFDGSFYALSDFLFRLRTLVSVRRGELHAAGRLFSVEAVDFSEAEAGFPMLAAVLKLQAYVYGTDVAGTTGPLPADPSAAPPATDGAAETPAPTDGAATASGATG
jgi:Pilus assembly protein, PilO